MQWIEELLGYFRYFAFCTRFALRHPLGICVYRGNPSAIPVNALPWFVNIVLIPIGVGMWCLSAKVNIPELAEPARLLTYGPIWTLINFGTAYRNGKRLPPRDK